MTVLRNDWRTLFVLTLCVVRGLAVGGKAETHCLTNVEIDGQMQIVCYALFEYHSTDNAVTEMKSLEEACRDTSIKSDSVMRKTYPLHIDVQEELDYLGDLISKRLKSSKCSSSFPVVRRGDSLPKNLEPAIGDCLTYNVTSKEFETAKCRTTADLDDSCVFVICKAKYVVPAAESTLQTPTTSLPLETTHWTSEEARSAEPPELPLAPQTSNPIPTSVPVKEEDKEGTIPCDGPHDVCQKKLSIKTFINISKADPNPVAFVTSLLLVPVVVVLYGT